MFFMWPQVATLVLLCLYTVSISAFVEVPFLRYSRPFHLLLTHRMQQRGWGTYDYIHVSMIPSAVLIILESLSWLSGFEEGSCGESYNHKDRMVPADLISGKQILFRQTFTRESILGEGTVNAALWDTKQKTQLRCVWTPHKNCEIRNVLQYTTVFVAICYIGIENESSRGPFVYAQTLCVFIFFVYLYRWQRVGACLILYYDALLQ